VSSQDIIAWPFIAAVLSRGKSRFVVGALTSVMLPPYPYRHAARPQQPLHPLGRVPATCTVSPCRLSVPCCLHDTQSHKSEERGRQQHGRVRSEHAHRPISSAHLLNASHHREEVPRTYVCAYAVHLQAAKARLATVVTVVSSQWHCRRCLRRCPRRQWPGSAGRRRMQGRACHTS